MTQKLQQPKTGKNDNSNLQKHAVAHNVPKHYKTGFVMNSKLSFSRLFQKIVGEKYIIFPERGSENYIIFQENQ